MCKNHMLLFSLSFFLLFVWMFETKQVKQIKQRMETSFPQIYLNSEVQFKLSRSTANKESAIHGC